MELDLSDTIDELRKYLKVRQRELKSEIARMESELARMEAEDTDARPILRVGPLLLGLSKHSLDLDHQERVMLRV